MNRNVVMLLAYEFSRQLEADIGKEYLMHVVVMNRDETDRGVCHSHDFCDSNMTMLRAFQSVLGRKVNMDCEIDLELWNTAWYMAKKLEFCYE